MELRVGRGKSTGKKGDPFYSGGNNPTVIHQPARNQRYYRPRPVVLPQGHTVLPLGDKRCYRKATRHYRADPRYYRCYGRN